MSWDPFDFSYCFKLTQRTDIRGEDGSNFSSSRALAFAIKGSHPLHPGAALPVRRFRLPLFEKPPEGVGNVLEWSNIYYVFSSNCRIYI